MYVVRILKRKDASSVVAAVVLALIAWQAVESFAERPSQWLAGATSEGGGWRAGVWQPLLTLLVQLLVLELLVRVYTWLVGSQGKK